MSQPDVFLWCFFPQHFLSIFLVLKLMNGGYNGLILRYVKKRRWGVLTFCSFQAEGFTAIKSWVIACIGINPSLFYSVADP
jgi:hypothetical protein